MPRVYGDVHDDNAQDVGAPHVLLVLGETLHSTPYTRNQTPNTQKP